MARGQALANTYLLPQDQVQLPGRNPVGRPPNPPNLDAAIPTPAEGLQFVEGATRDYYDKWANLKSFVHTMNSSFGIDVTKPDFSDPAAMAANELYTKAVADIMFQGDQLKNSQKMLNDLLQREADGKAIIDVDTTQGALSMMDARDLQSTTQASDFVTEANKHFRRRFFTKEEYDQNLEDYKQIEAHFEQLAQEDPENAEYYQQQFNMIRPPSKSTKIFAPKDSQNNDEITIGNQISKVSNLAVGAGASWQTSSLDPSKLVSSEYSGTKWGQYVDSEDGKKKDLILDHWERDAETGEVSMVFKGNGGSEVVGDNDAAQLLRNYFMYNPKAGDVEDLDSYLSKHSLLNKAGELDPKKFLSSKFANRAEEQLKEIKGNIKHVNFTKNRIKEELKALTRISGVATYPISEEFGGGELKIERGFSSGDYFIANIDELYPSMSAKEKARYKNLNEEDVLNILLNFGSIGILSAQNSWIKPEPTTEPQEEPINTPTKPISNSKLDPIGIR